MAGEGRITSPVVLCGELIRAKALVGAGGAIPETNTRSAPVREFDASLLKHPLDRLEG
jgi:hypothetical protein